jgi:hypothetical protein
VPQGNRKALIETEGIARSQSTNVRVGDTGRVVIVRRRKTPSRSRSDADRQPLFAEFRQGLINLVLSATQLIQTLKWGPPSGLVV